MCETTAAAAPLPPHPAACATTVELKPPPRHSSPSRGSSEPRERAARRSGSCHPVVVVVLVALPSAMGEAEESVRERDRRESVCVGREKPVLSLSPQRKPTATAPHLATTATPSPQIVPRLGFVSAVNWVTRRSRTKQRET
ncbi:hypothetical protein HN873_018520 [Arachis hypogaea]|nr:uncharacterized protein LOC114924174 [Arachis hypogaea]QHO46163.1 uncharacterized protein DS421_6g185000 [Arachis hypogaea]